MFDGDGKRVDFVLKSKKDIQQEFIDSSYAELAPLKTLNQIKRLEAMPCYENADGSQLEPAEWGKHMLPISCIGDDQQYFVATANQIFQTP